MIAAGDRRFLKLIDMKYHRKCPGFTKQISDKLDRNDWLLNVYNEGSSYTSLACSYKSDLGRIGAKVYVSVPGLSESELNSLVTCFSDTSSISDEEWSFYTVVMGDLHEKLCKQTEYLANMQLYLEGRSTVKISFI